MDLESTHRRLLAARRHVMNLVGPGPLEPHYDDAVAGLRGLSPSGRWADLGSGAGFPGLVWAARCPDLGMDLVESRRKRAIFLETVVREAGVGHRVAVHNVRVEALPSDAYDGIVTRAFAPPDVALPAGLRLVKMGGVVALFLSADARLPQVPGAAMFHVEHYAVGDRQHCVVAWRREPIGGVARESG